MMRASRRSPRLGQELFGRDGARRFGLMLVARFGGVGCEPAAFGLRRGKRRFQIFDPGAGVGEHAVLFGRRARQPRVLAGRGIEFFLHAVARHAQFRTADCR